jgi:lipopolysaccharide export system protein LptC
LREGLSAACGPALPRLQINILFSFIGYGEWGVGAMSAWAGTSYERSASGDGRLAGATERAAAFERARRHTRRVRLLRKALPMAGIAVLAALVLLARAPAPGGIDFSVARTTVTDSGVVMHEPRLSGYDRQDRSFRLRADTATQKLARPDHVEMQNVLAEIQSPDRGDVVITAGSGEFDNRERTLALYGGVHVDSADGYRVILEDVHVTIDERALKSDRPIEIYYEEGHTTANSIRVTENGKLVILEGKVRTSVMPPRHERAEVDRPMATQGGLR